MGLVSLMICQGLSCWSSELLGGALLGFFCCCFAATLPYTALHQAIVSYRVIEHSGRPAGGRQLHQLHLLLCDSTAVHKGRTVPVFMYGFPNEGESKQWSI